MDNDQLSMEEINKLKEEVKNLEGSVLMLVTKRKYDLMRGMAADMPTYDNESMAKREFYRGVADGLNWFLKDINSFIDRNEKVLQKRKE
mgnify:CR=1 FL=1